MEHMGSPWKAKEMRYNFVKMSLANSSGFTIILGLELRASALGFWAGSFRPLHFVISLIREIRWA